MSALGQLVHEDAQGGRNNLQPGRNDFVSIDEVFRCLFEPQHGAGLIPNINDVVLGHPAGRNVHLLTVDQEVAVGNQLTGLTASASQTCAVHNIVQAGFQQDHQVFTGLAGHAVRLGIITAELLLQHTIGVLCLLLFLQLK